MHLYILPSLRSIEFRYPNKDGAFEGSTTFQTQFNCLYHRAFSSVKIRMHLLMDK